ncbi:MAG: hypothetical protein HYT72_03610 [Candidatus Aenigmarchaeota archaeon]|nr:hypothetical protein [Candidatus Aenigmarchaeota archaeon]
MEKTIKVSEKTYRRINELVGALREKKGKPVSINEALSEVLTEMKKSKPSDFAGSWKMSDKEAANLKKEIRELWKSWKI